MEPWIDRVRNSFRKATDRVTGRHVPVVSGPSGSEELQEGAVTLRPAVDIFENGQEVLLEVDVPGSTPDDARISVDESRRLTIRAPRHGTDETWLRVFTLPDYVDTAAARAALDRGVLSVHLPKRADAHPRSIPIRASTD